MKKLMITAASAAVGLGAFALDYVPEAYEMCITLKTTTCKEGVNKVVAEVCDGGNVTYRTKANQKIQGLFWGCDCPTIADPVAFTTFQDDPDNPTQGFGTQGQCHGYVFWDASVKTKDPYKTAEFNWTDGDGKDGFLQYFGSSAKDVEGLFTLSLSDTTGDEVVRLQGAGMGTACWSKEYLTAYIQSMSGNVTGWAFPGYLSFGCKACGESKAGCSAWTFCEECEEREEDYPSVAYGTFTLKFNKSVAQKYAKGTDRYAILSAYKFSDAVKAYLIETDAGYDPEPTERTPAEKTYDAAKKAYNDAVAYNKTLQDAVDLAKYNQTNGVAIAAASNTVVTAEKKMLDTKKDFLNPTTTVQQDIRTSYSTEIAKYWSDAEAYLSLWANNGYSNTVNVVSSALDTMEVSKNALEVALQNDSKFGASAKKDLKDACADLYADAKAFAETTYGVAILENRELTIAKWTFHDVNAELKKAYDEAVKYQRENKKDETSLKNAMDTAKIICDATGGDCD